MSVGTVTSSPALYPDHSTTEGEARRPPQEPTEVPLPFPLASTFPSTVTEEVITMETSRPDVGVEPPKKNDTAGW